jgi:dienelactone hydrolase
VRARLYRPSTAHRSLVLVPDGTRDHEAVETLARILARRGLMVLVPASLAADPVALRAYTAELGMPNDVEPVSRFEPSEDVPSPATRAAHAWRIFRLSRTLLE